MVDPWSTQSINDLPGEITLKGPCFFGLSQDAIFFSVLLIVVALSLLWQVNGYEVILWQLQNHTIHEKTPLLYNKGYLSHGSIQKKISHIAMPSYRTGMPCDVSCNAIIVVPLIWLIWIACTNYIFKS